MRTVIRYTRQAVLTAPTLARKSDVANEVVLIIIMRVNLY